METKKDLANELLQYVSTGIYDTLCDLRNKDMKSKKSEYKKQYENWSRGDIVKDMIDDCLTALNVEVKDLKSYTDNNNDFWNDKNINGNYWCDMRSEYANGMISIYNSDLWDHAFILSEYIEEAISEFSGTEEVIKQKGIIGLFMQGEYYFYEQFCLEILEGLKKYCEDLED